jgi:hypothetical protein
MILQTAGKRAVMLLWLAAPVALAGPAVRTEADE